MKPHLHLMLAAALAVALPAARAANREVQSTYINSGQPTIDGSVASGEWANAGSLSFDHGRLLVFHDDTTLYLLIDVTDDTQDDQLVGGTGDFFWLDFDVDLDGRITANLDVSYAEATGSGALGISTYTAPHTITALKSTGATMGRGFGGTDASSTPHRFWELSLPLSEISQGAPLKVRLALRVYSINPGFDERMPASMGGDFNDAVDVIFKPDCNNNNVEDSADISGGTSQDCNGNGVPDECENDTDGDGIIDDCDPTPGWLPLFSACGCGTPFATTLCVIGLLFFGSGRWRSRHPRRR